MRRAAPRHTCKIDHLPGDNFTIACNRKIDCPPGNNIVSMPRRGILAKLITFQVIILRLRAIVKLIALLAIILQVCRAAAYLQN